MEEKAVKLYDPQEPVTITLTRDQWDMIINSLKNDADRFHGFSVSFRDCCASAAFAEETTAPYVRAYQELDALRAQIEQITLEPWLPKKEEEDNV